MYIKKAFVPITKYPITILIMLVLSINSIPRILNENGRSIEKQRLKIGIAVGWFFSWGENN